MDVFLVPVGDGGYELYCEPSEADHPTRGVTAHVLRRAREVIAVEQEARRDRRAARRAGNGKQVDGWLVRMRVALTRGMAEWVAQQRLLWHLRYVNRAVVVHPDDVDNKEALSIARGRLQHHSDHHRFWMVIDGLAMAVLGPLFFFVPGPNLLSWYFAVKAAGHWLAFRGARRGATSVEWAASTSVVLTAVREVLPLPAGQRRSRLRALSRQLHLEQLATFVERTSAR